MPWFTIEADCIPEQEIKRASARLIAEARERIAGRLKRVLLLPPDLTRALYRTEADMQALPHAVAHLIHGSSEDRFTITYAPGHLTREEIEQAGYRYADPTAMLKRYDPAVMREGWNTAPDGEEIFYIGTPSAGLWSTHAKLNNPARRELASR